jgi:hypothetical protein
MQIQFFDDPSNAPRSREDVRLNQLAVWVHPDGSRRLAVGFDITPFLEKPSIEVQATNEQGEPAGNLTIIETNESNFHLTLHLRDRNPTDLYTISATLYYALPEKGKTAVDSRTVQADMRLPGSQVTA